MTQTRRTRRWTQTLKNLKEHKKNENNRGVWHNGNLPQGTNTIGLSRMTPWSQLIFDKSDSVRSRTEECKNHSHVKTEKFRSNYHQSCRNFGPNKVMLDPSCTWIRCTMVSSCYSNGPFNSDLVETFKTNAFNAFVLDRVIGPFGTCNRSLLVFLGWSTSGWDLDLPFPSVWVSFLALGGLAFA
jgi:hypothetical protein